MSVLIEKGDAIRPGNPATVSRYRLVARLNHWVTAVSMLLLVLSGLAMFHPVFFFLTALFGDGETTRAIHPWIGIVLFVSFVLLFMQFWRGNLWARGDLSWTLRIGYMLAGREDKMPEAGKYNAGQKFVFWAMALLILVLFASGLVIWEEYFVNFTPVESRRLAALAHSLAATLVILVLILHVAAGAWVRGSFDAMIKGWVTAGWAWRHHRKWFRSLAGGAEQQPGE